MKKSLLLLVTSVLFLSFVPCSLLAQSDPPPPPPSCCDAPTGGNTDADQTVRTVESQFTVSRVMLQRQGITRSQFVDRLSESLFPGKRVDLVITSSRLVTPSAVTGRMTTSVNGLTSREEGLVAVQEKRIFQISRDRIGTEELDRLDELFLTDGEVFIRVTFARGESQGNE